MSHFTTGQVVTAADLNELHPLLGEGTAGGGSTTLSIVSIPQTHRDLLVIVHGSNVGSQQRAITVQFNGDTGSNYRWIRVATADNGSPTRSSSQSANGIVPVSFGDDANLSQFRLEIADYSSDVNHVVTWQGGQSSGSAAGSSEFFTGTGQHISGAAITSIELQMAVDNWASGSTFKIYGLGLL